MSEAKKVGIGGNSKNTLLEYMRTQAWLAYLMEKTGAKTFGEIDGAILGKRLRGQSIEIKKQLLNDETTIRGSKYGSNQQGPNEAYLNLVEGKVLGSGSKAVYEIGPLEKNRNIPLWAIFEQDFNVIWECVDNLIPEMTEMRKRGAPFSKRLERVVKLFVPLDDWSRIDFKNPENHPSKHLVLDSWHKNYFQATLELLVVAMAIYRLHLKADENMAQVEYLIRGLLAEPYRAVLQKHNIYDLFVAAFNQLEINDLIQRGEINLAENLLLKMTGAKL